MESISLDDLVLEDVPIIDFKTYFDKSDEKAWRLECKKVAQSFHQFGIAIVRDPRVHHKNNEEYIDMMERYFKVMGEKYYAG
jgi:isopenicillin N synthase-like dioxygenase